MKYTYTIGDIQSAVKTVPFDNRKTLKFDTMAFCEESYLFLVKPIELYLI